MSDRHWTLTAEGDRVIVDCDDCGEEIGAVAAAWAGPDRNEYGRAAELFDAHQAQAHAPSR